MKVKMNLDSLWTHNIEECIKNILVILQYDLAILK